MEYELEDDEVLFDESTNPSLDHAKREGQEQAPVKAKPQPGEQRDRQNGGSSEGRQRG